MSVAPVILAAGASQRLGEPKALVDLGGRSVIQRLVEVVQALPGAPLVITGHHHAEIEAHAARWAPDAEVAYNPDWSEGRTSGVVVAASRRPGADLLICPADVPLVSAALIDSLAAEWIRRGAPARGWLAPSVEGPPPHGRRFGHPILIGARLASEARELSADAPLRDLRARAGPLLALATSDLAILDDLDAPEDLRTLRERLERPPRAR